MDLSGLRSTRQSRNVPSLNRSHSVLHSLLFLWISSEEVAVWAPDPGMGRIHETANSFTDCSSPFSLLQPPQPCSCQEKPGKVIETSQRSENPSGCRQCAGIHKMAQMPPRRRNSGIPLCLSATAHTARPTHYP